MTEQTIPAEKVWELIEHFESKDIGIESYGIIGRFRALLPTPPQPTTGLLGRWAKHPEHGDVVCVWNKSDVDGYITVRWIDGGMEVGVSGLTVPLTDLTFPHQANRPAEVQPGEAWRIRDTEGNEFNAVKTSSGYYTTDRSGYTWLFCDHDGNGHWLENKEVTLIAPLTPERPGKDDLQAKSTERALDRVKAKYDELEWEYKQAQAEITWLKAGNTPRTVTTEAEYAALPIGSRVSVGSEFRIWEKASGNGWKSDEQVGNLRLNAFLDGITRMVLRYGWGDEQSAPVWRIEHDWQNLKVGEYVICEHDMEGPLKRKSDDGSHWITANSWAIHPENSPFIVFPSKDAATPEAIEEAKRARDKEMDK